MSVYFEDSEKVDALAERLLQRAEQRILVDNYYTYEYVANSSNLSGSNVQGSIFAIHDFFLFLHKCTFSTSGRSTHSIEGAHWFQKSNFTNMFTYPILQSGQMWGLVWTQKDNENVCANLKPLWVDNTQESIPPNHSTTEITCGTRLKSS